MACLPKFTPHPKSAPGDFYVVKGECLACGVPHVVAPDLVGWADEKVQHCFWKKQPETPAELERAIAVLEAQELECHRYAGTNSAILNRVSSSYCDYPLPSAHVPLQTDPPLPRFALLDDRPSLLARVWRVITGRSPSF
jgi:hypothetical protein